MLDQAWRLSSSVALRPEPFGALAYNFGNRRLTFLKRPELVALVTSLSQHPTVRSALAASDIPETQWGGYVDALLGLAAAGMLSPEQEAAA